MNLRTGLKFAMSNEQGVSPIQLALMASFIQICFLGSFPTCRGGGGLQVFSGGELPPFVDCQPCAVVELSNSLYWKRAFPKHITPNSKV